MPSTPQHGLESWSVPLPLILAMLLAAILYMRGCLHLRSTRLNVVPAWRAYSFLIGLFLIWVAVGSPLAALDEQLLTVHMIQHLLLMTFAPGLILLGAPVMPWFAATLRASRSGSIIPVAAGAAAWAGTFATCLLLGCRCRRISGMARPGGVCPSIAIGNMACGRTRKLPRGRIPFLVARYSALAKYCGVSAMVDPPLPFPGYAAVRHPFRFSGVLRACLPRLFLHAAGVRHFRPRRSAMCRRVDVDLHHDCLSCTRGDSGHAVANGPGVSRA